MTRVGAAARSAGAGGLLLALVGLPVALLPLAAAPARAQPVDLVDTATRQLAETAAAAEARGDWKRAAAAWRLVLGRDPVYAPAVLGLGRCQQAQGDLAGAARTLGRLPADPDAVEALARLVEPEDPARAAELYGRLQSLRLGEPEPHRLQVLALARVDPLAALQGIDLWLALVEGEPDGLVFVQVAMALRERGAEEEARRVLEHYIEGWPDGASADEVRGRLDRMAV
ncbi:hypothetical protein L6R53_15525, partial [Myxococcota bacterium]|nr:hypothetical protein [Myxococcota bacterium]